MTIPESMSANLVQHSLNSGRALPTVLWATLIAGALDICAAMLSVQLRGIPAIQAVKGVAAGWLGREAFAGGGGVIALGFASHFFIMGVIAAVFYLATRAFPILTERWIWAGVAFGIAVYFAMTFIVVPLSAFPTSGPPSLASMLLNIGIMVTCVGLPIAYVTQRFAPGEALALSG